MRAVGGVVRHFTVLVALSVPSAQVTAQLLGDNLLGDIGLKSGTQPPQGIYAAAPYYYRADYNGLRDKDGNSIARGTNADLNFLGAPGFYVVTNAKLFRATYGFQILVPYSNTRLTVAQAPDVSSGAGGGYGFTDMYVQPINLGWHASRADYLAGYAFFAPTGELGHSLEQWAHELSAGTTVYLDEARMFHASATAFFEMHSNKRGKDLRTGDILTIEGGVGASFLEGVVNAGVAYGGQWKVNNDSGSDTPANSSRSQSRVLALGPELSAPVFAFGTLVGLITLRYEWQFNGRSTFEGRTFVAGFTLAQLGMP